MTKLIVLTAAARGPALYSPAVMNLRSMRMSWLSVGLRDVGLGGVVDALDGVEPAIKAAVSTPQAVALETQTVEQVGNAAQTTVVNAITKAIPEASTIAPEVLGPFTAGLEAFVLHFFQNATTTSPAPGPTA